MYLLNLQKYTKAVMKSDDYGCANSHIVEEFQRRFRQDFEVFPDDLSESDFSEERRVVLSLL